MTKKPEVIDDFLRNFYAKMGLARTAEAFEAEWYEMKATGRLHGNHAVPDVYQRNTVSAWHALHAVLAAGLAAAVLLR